MADPTILIVEDDHMIAELLAYNLKEAGHLPVTFQDGRQLFRALEQNRTWLPDLFILDLMLPGMDGYEICQKLRQMHQYEWIPILMLTARGSEADKVRGLDSGADDYLTKPFGMKELLARVNALHRRYQKAKQPEAVQGTVAGSVTAAGPVAPAGTEDGLYRCSDLILDDVSHRVLKKDKEVEMTNREYELLKFLMMNRGIAFSRDDLLNHVWGFEYGGETRTVDVHIRQLRRKIEDNDAEPVMIETVRGRGYRFNDQIST
jgi:two-component system alkaline phosphatase synthesis response regulator PhoP